MIGIEDLRSNICNWQCAMDVVFLSLLKILRPPPLPWPYPAPSFWPSHHKPAARHWFLSLQSPHIAVVFYCSSNIFHCVDSKHMQEMTKEDRESVLREDLPRRFWSNLGPTIALLCVCHSLIDSFVPFVPLSIFENPASKDHLHQMMHQNCPAYRNIFLFVCYIK